MHESQLCQEYLATLKREYPPSRLAAMSPPVEIIVIGHGTPALLGSYVKRTALPYPLYTDPSKALYQTLGMGRTLDGGSKPKYQTTSTLGNIVTSASQALGRLVAGAGQGESGGRADFWRGGDFSQVGGEMLLRAAEGTESGFECVWIHRMRNTRDHAEMDVLSKALGEQSA